MRIFIQLLVIFGTLLGFGTAKLKFEDQLSQEMVQQRLIQPPLKQGTHLKLGQTSAAVTLGGLRALVAAAWNLRAFVQFENTEWVKLEQSYQVITTLQPETIHYWETGAWHLHTNAAFYYREDPDLPPFRRNALYHQYLNKGSNFLEEGARQNPNSWRLHDNLGRVWTSQHKSPDYPRALVHYENALACDSMSENRRGILERTRFYCMARIPERAEEALELGQQLFRQSRRNHLPSLINYIFALQNAVDAPAEKRISDEELYPSKQRQLQWLQYLWARRNQDFPVHGVLTKIRVLEQELNNSHQIGQ